MSLEKLKQTYIMLFLLLLAGALGLIRFIAGGDEDTWLCFEGQWLKHGNPTATMPSQPCQP